MSLIGRTAIVTGVSPGGVGLHTAIGLVREGAHVVLASRSEAKAREAMAEITRYTYGTLGSASFIQLDLSSLASVRRCV